jgi:hypothetical protein
MLVMLAGGSSVDVPDSAVVVRPAPATPLPDPERTIRESVRPWLRGLRPPAVVVLPSIPFPQSVVLPALFSELARVGLRRESLTLLCSPEVVVDPESADRHDVQIHDTTDLEAHVEPGGFEGCPVLLDRRYVEATTRISLGVVEPHSACGFTGGPESVCPGVAAEPTVRAVQDRVGAPGATLLALQGNPVHDFIRAAVKLAPPRLSLDLTVAPDGLLTGVWCGPLPHAHLGACAEVSRRVASTVASEADTVVVAGEPLVTAVAAAERVIRPGGTIIAVTDRGWVNGGWEDRVLQRVQARASVTFVPAAAVSLSGSDQVVVLPDAPHTIASLAP